MNESYAQFLKNLQFRHATNFEYLSRALAGRHPRLLRMFGQRQGEVEREAARILTLVDHGGRA